jgi:hydrogenase expression/formation protein HypE
MSLETATETLSGDASALGGTCPMPLNDYKEIVLAHGSGGKLSQRLLQSIVLPQFRNELLAPLHDGAVFALDGSRVAFSTDSYVVSPIFFPGGDIGKLAVHGTVNDLAMCGARPLHLSVGFILEEGLPMADFRRIVQSMHGAAAEAGVTFVTGDTKVVDRGKADKVFINTAGIGLVPEGVNIQPSRAQVVYNIIISRQIAVHGIAIMSVREGLEFETEIASDTAPLNGLVDSILDACEDIHVLRDPTRGGVTSALSEIAQSAQVGMLLDEAQIPISEEVKGACEILGLDPLYVANEGKLLAILPAADANGVLAAMRAHPLGSAGAVIGQVTSDHPGYVLMKTRISQTRVVHMPSCTQYPRISSYSFVQQIKPPRRRNPLRVRRHRGSHSPPRKSASCTRWTFPPGSFSHKPGQGYRRFPF